MIVCDEKKFVFVHIPKCAGVAIKHQMSRYNSGGPRLGITDHPTLGRIHTGHIPLAFLKEFDEALLEKVRTYTAFAIVREPGDRFVSAVLQRLREFGNANRTGVSTAQIVDEAKRVIEHVKANPHLCQAEYIHMVPQVDFIELEGETVVHNLFPLCSLDSLSLWLRERFDIEFEASRRTHVGFVPRSGPIRAVRSALKPALVALLSSRTRERLRRGLMQTGLIAIPAKLRQQVLSNPDIQEFVANHYARDAVLYDECRSKHIGQFA